MSRRNLGQGPNGGSGVPLAVIYTRVSTDAQERDGVSLDVQLRECRQYVIRQSWIHDSEFTDTLSGRRTDRPGYQELLARVRSLRAQGRNAVVVVSALDRFGRKVLERVRSREELKALGVTTHSVREGGEVSDLVANVLAAVAQEEVERTGMRVRATWRSIAEQGWFKVSAMLPWGYRSRAATAEERAAGSPKTVIEPDPVAAPLVTELFRRAASGESTWSVAKWAAALPAETRGYWVSGRGSTPHRELTRRSVAKILRNDVYVAPSPARWQAIVDERTWKAVQRRLDATRDAPRAKPAQYRLSGFLVCPNCGSRMNGEQSGKYRRYRCQAWRQGGSSTAVCNMSVDAGQVEAQVLEEISKIAATFATSDRKRLARDWNQLARPAEQGDASRQIRQLEQQIETARRRITTATQKFVDDEITKPAYDGMVATEQAALESAEAEIGRLRSAADPIVLRPPLEEVLPVLERLSSWSGPLGDTTVLREVLTLLVEKITPVRIRWGTYKVGLTRTLAGRDVADLLEAA